MKKRSLLFLICSFLLFSKTRAQENMFCNIPDSGLFSKVSSNGWIKFRQDLSLKSSSVFSEHKKSFGFEDEKYEMRETKRETDKYGGTHIRLQEHYNSIPILFGDFLLHEKNGQLSSGNGKIYTTTKSIPSSPEMTKEKSIDLALANVNAKKYYWNDTAKENKIKRKSNDPTATYYPKPQLLYYYNDKMNAFQFCYRIVIQCFDAGKSSEVFIDASTGSIFLLNPLETSTCDPTTVNTVWYGNKTVYTYTDAFTSGWDLEDDCTPSTYKVFDAANSNDIFNSSNNTWTSQRQRSAATSLWSIRQTRDVYKNSFERNGHDNDDQNIDIYFDYVWPGNDRDNASYRYDQFGDDEINIGCGSTSAITDDYGALDIMAHEFTHGVTQYSAELVYNREPGALNESFSDVMAEFVENKVLGSNNWLLGWDRMVLIGNSLVNAPIRSCIAPGLYRQPDRYLGLKNWSNATSSCSPTGPPSSPSDPVDNDNCGVHTNSGVQNRMFYLLSMGGNGWTDDSSSTIPSQTPFNSYQWSVQGIGIDKAGRIAYNALLYLISSSGYLDSRNAWVAAATNLYGECSQEAIQTGKAWYAVGIGPSTSTPAGNTYCDFGYGVYPLNLTKPGFISLSPNCTVYILPTGNQVTFTSANRVIINPGFTAFEGSKFTANINIDCLFAQY
jgi:Zn-dependent metalloprotease